MWSRRVLFLLILIATGTLAIMYRVNATVILLLTVITGMVIDFVVLLVCSFFIKIQLSFSKREVQIGESIKLNLIIINKSILWINKVKAIIQYSNSFEGREYIDKISGEIGACNKEILLREYKTRHTGMNRFCVKKVYIYSFLGLFKTKIKNSINIDVFVLPNKSDISEDLVISESEEVLNYRQDIPGEDRGEVFEIREYRDGDNMKNIHWNLSSTKESMMVKVFSEPLENKILIYVNYSSKLKSEIVNNIDEYLKEMDSLVKKMVDLSEGLLKKGKEHICAFDCKEGLKCYEIKKKEDVHRALRDMMALTPCDETCLPEGVEILYPEYNYEKIMYVTMPLSKEEEDLVRKHKQNQSIEIFA